MPEVAIIVTTFERPRSLSKVLTSLSNQDFRGDYQVIVADDGSVDSTPDVVRRHAASAMFPLSFVTHRHRGFELARRRNQGMLASQAPYLIYLDGDCVAPPNFLTRHMRLRQERTAVAGFTCHLDQQTSSWLDESVIAQGEYSSWADRSAVGKLKKLDRKANFYRLLRHRSKPRLRGGNFGVWRSDFQRVNGFDESFVGWGCEDDDFGMRLRRAGVVVKNAFQAIPTFHLWHPVDTSAPKKWSAGANADYLHRECRWTRCVNGIKKRALSEFKVRVTGNQVARDWLKPILEPATLWLEGMADPPDIEVVVDSDEQFQGNTDYKVLVLPEPTKRLPSAAKRADLILTDDVIDVLKDVRQIPLTGFQNFLESVTSRKPGDTNRAAAA